MIGPTLSLAISVHSNRGVYALLLGTGLSKSSGVPTGWEIVQDLIRKLAALKGAGSPADAETWYRTVFGREPDYSEILDEIAKSPAERMQLLRGYFEPSEQEREEGRKLPTAAHRAIAQLIAKGYVQVVVTTNFDQLLEQALVDVGIHPMVTSTPDPAKGALPLAHSRCTVVKVNGDYLDSRLRNTAGELAHYGVEMDQLLDQVFDEYGLIVCGWSADWDIALRCAIERCPTRRFTTYWAAYGKLGETAQKLVHHRCAAVFEISGADELFKDLLDKISALEQLAQTDPMPTKVAVARMKKYLADEAHRISLCDLLNAETERTFAALRNPRFTSKYDPRIQVTQEAALAKLQAYEVATDALLHLTICGGYWVRPQQHALLSRCFRRAADWGDPQSGQLPLWNNLRRYPALLLLYGIGLAAIAGRNYLLLKHILHLPIRDDSYHPEQPLVRLLHDQAVMERDDQRWLFQDSRTGLSDHLFAALRDPLREYLADDVEYDQTFDWFEYLLCLSHCDVQITRADLQHKKEQDPGFTLWASVGRFAWKRGGLHDIEQRTEIPDEQPHRLPETVAAVIKAGFFESAGQVQMLDKYRDIKAAFDRHLATVRAQWGLYLR